MKKSNFAAATLNNHEKGNNGTRVLNRERNILIDTEECQRSRQQREKGLFIDADAVQIIRFSIKPRAMSPIVEA